LTGVGHDFSPRSCQRRRRAAEDRKIGRWATGAKPLAGTGWPGATNLPYIGAAAPAAQTGLDQVDVPPSVVVGV
jgi:hypothetical protein